ncbi:glycosyltransferase 87 family protein [Streptomyces armeniacus]
MVQQTAAGRTSATAWSYVVRRPTFAAALLCLVSFAAFWSAQRATDVSMIDLMVYRAEGWAARSGQDLYLLRATHADLPATYPPFAALLFMPLTLLDIDDMRTTATLLNLGLLIALVHLALRLTGRPLRIPRPAAVLVLAALAVWCEPVWTTLRYGQVNLLLAALVVWDLSRRPDHRWAGVGTGIAAGIKLTPALFAVFLALCGIVEGWRRLRHTGVVTDVWNPRLRQATMATGAFLATALLSAVVLPRDSHRFWSEVLFTSDRAGDIEGTANQSLRGVLARLLHTPDPGTLASVLAVAVAAAGLAVAVAAFLAGPRRLAHAPAWAALACAATALLVSPVTWSHHWVWCVPLVLLLGTEALHRTSVRWWTGTCLAALIFCTYALWLVPHKAVGGVRPELHQGFGEMLLSGLYPLAGAAFLVLAATRAVRALRRPVPYELPRGGSGSAGGGAARQSAAPAPRQAVAKE